MRAVILAAGLGSRLLPHTETRPKCLLRVGGRTILEYQMAALRQCGITDVVLVVGYQQEKIRGHLDVPVTFVENTEYSSTGSSYSLWLARDLIQDGFIYVNSDLIFHPRMLSALLDAPAPDAIVVDRHVNLTGDMQKAAMEGDRVVRMSKTMAAEQAAAEVVGPAKFSADGARRIVAYLDGVIAGGDRSRWAYEAFGEVANERPFVGIDNPGCFWAEVDTPGDLIEAAQRMPAVFIDFRAARIAAPDRPDERRLWDITRQPVPSMDRLLNSNFTSYLQGIPAAERRVREVLLENRDRFAASLGALGVSEPSPAAIHRATSTLVETVEAELSTRYRASDLSSADGLDRLLSDVLPHCPADLVEGFVLSRASAIRLLDQLPPVGLIHALGYQSITSLLDHEDPLDVLAICRTTEDDAWQARYKQLLATCTADDFEQRPIRYFVSDVRRLRPAFQNSKHPPKLWRISHNKEAGIITCLTMDETTAAFRVPLLQYVIVFIHYFFEVAYASQYYRRRAEVHGERLGQEVVGSIYSHARKLTFFYSNVYAENLFWERALDVFGRAFGSDAVRFFTSCAACGEYVSSAGAQDAIVSLNLIDHVWNLNFLGHGVGVDTFQHDTIYFLYHFRGALWQAIVNAVTGLSGQEMEDLIVQHLASGDTALTSRLLAAPRPQLV